MSDQAHVRRLGLDSEVVGANVPMSVVLPPGHDPDTAELPLIIMLHGGGADREMMVGMLPLFQAMFASAALQPAVLVSFSSGPMSWFHGTWEAFITEELPRWASAHFNARTDRGGVAMTGISMGGYGTAKIGFKHPERFCAIAPMEPAIEPSFAREPDLGRDTWWRGLASGDSPWGNPVNESSWMADNPANIVRQNADAIRTSGLEIYLEVGDQDYINLHDGAEFLHRLLWDHDIRHEYHLVRWADHVGSSFLRRVPEAFSFMSAALNGGLAESTDEPLTEAEQLFVSWSQQGMDNIKPMPEGAADMGTSPRSVSMHARMWDPAKKLANDPTMSRAYAILPPTDT